jgi:hypothetical protein
VNANLRVLRRCEAVQMVTDLRTATENVISLLAESSDVDKVLGAETLVLLQTKRNILESEILWAERDAIDAAERDLEMLKRAAVQKGGAQ